MSTIQKQNMIDPRMDEVTQLLKRTTDKVYSLNSRLDNMKRVSIQMEIEALLILERVKDLNDTIELMESLKDF